MLSSGRFLLIAAVTGVAAGASAGFSGVSIPRRHLVEPAVRAVINKGPERELVISCADGDKTLVSRAAEGGVWCEGGFACHGSLEAAIRNACE